MSEQEILALAAIIKETSEVLWQVALIKVYADAIQCLIWTAIFTACLLGSSLGALRAFHISKKQGSVKGDWEIVTVILAVAAFVSLIAVGGFSSAAAGRLFAPEFFAIKIILGLTL